MSQFATAEPLPAIRVSLMRRVFAAFFLIAAASLLISVGGRWLGGAIALGGHSDDPTPREIVIGNDVVVVPANAIRHERARRNGVAPRLDLYLRWPDMRGYSAAAQADFDHAGGSRRILFLSFEPRMMSRDMSGRFEPIYRSLIGPDGQAGPGGIRLHAFSAASGYANEELAVAGGEGAEPFVARCMAGANAEESLAPCERDLIVGKELSLTYRFPRELLGDWRRLDAAIRRFAQDAVKRGG